MIYAVEGNVNVGKTTFIEEYAYKNKLRVLKENVFPKKIKLGYNRQLAYLELEQKRKESISNQSTILDRSILSIYLYTILSSEFTEKDRESIVYHINELIHNKKVIVPDQLFFIMYPFELINNNHMMLVKDKHTQEILVSYNYYRTYNLFFANQLKNKDTLLLNTMNYRQIIQVKDNAMYHNLKNQIPKFEKVILLDGAPAIGKTTIGKMQNEYTHILEQIYKKYTLLDYTNQIKSIINRVKLINKSNILVDTSFLMGITHLFYSHERELNKNEKLDVIYKIMENVPLYLYISKIIYLYADIDILYARKNADTKRNRKHFEENIKYLEYEKNFYKSINLLMGDFSNIYLIEANKSVDILIKEVQQKEENPIFLVDLFFYIIKGIENGEI